MTIPEHIKQKIKEHASWNDYPDTYRTAAEYGYQLAHEEIERITECHDGLKADLERCKKVAQEEIERLKGLIETAFFDRGHSRAATENSWQQFKQTNNL
jgi:hypothetical protein